MPPKRSRTEESKDGWGEVPTTENDVIELSDVSSDEEVADTVDSDTDTNTNGYEGNDDGDDSDNEDDVYVSDDDDGDLNEFLTEEEQEDSDEEGDIGGLKVLHSFNNETEEEVKERKKRELDQEPSMFDDVDNSDDSSEDEGMINTVGNIPLEWYEEYDHIGYDVNGNRILRKKRKDALDNLIASHDDPNYLRTVYDELNDKEHILSNKDLQTIIDVQKGRFPSNYNPYRPMVEYVTIDSRFPLVGTPTPKKHFTPDKDELKHIARLARRMRKNPKVGVPQIPQRNTPECYLMWGQDGRVIGDTTNRVGLLQAPKTLLPGHGQSYNPPMEYVPEDSQRRLYDSLRKVPAYDKFIQERYRRCLDLYMAPRVQIRKKVIPDPEKLLPELPDPESLRPYPEIPSLVIEGHHHIIRSVSINPTGTHVVSGSDDHTVRLWEVDTSRCVRVWKFHADIQCVRFNPNAGLNLFAVCVGLQVYLIHCGDIGSEAVNEATRKLFPDASYDETKSILEVDEEEELEMFKKDEQENESDDESDDESEDDQDGEKDIQKEQVVSSSTKTGRKKVLLRWEFYRTDQHKEKRSQGIMACLYHLKQVTQIDWHVRGDYFVSLSPTANNDGIVIHQLSNRTSQKPFKKALRNKGQKVVSALFHPTQPHFYVATSRNIMVFNLQRQKLQKKLKGQKCRDISSMSIHPNGGHVLTGGYDRRMEWFDMEISSRPYKTMRFHRKAVRSVAFHKRYPLFATASDDGQIHVFHCQVFVDDWLKDPIIVPVKILRGHKITSHLGVLDIEFHPTQPWLISGGADQTIRLFTS
ncbi:rRNA maturation protein bop1 [Acrasis kona]|uniref:Ribosome biogenesis protein BOP1 homolog n=1 Tax=Acrasis kona TaxID=1008807 RepID=A0AAW2ZFJ4_9EUKA